MAGRRRELSAAERALWERVAASMRRLGPPRVSQGAASPGAEAGKPAETALRGAPPRPRPGSPKGRPPKQEPMPQTGIDRRTDQRLRRGAVAPDARIDLHGMTQTAAHAALARFLVQARERGSRLVLVITGKGGPAGDDEGWVPGEQRGVLRRQVPFWLASAEFAGLVSGFREAHKRHGGAGALYVRLRRPRS